MPPDIFLPHAFSITIKYIGLIIEYIGLGIVAFSAFSALLRVPMKKYSIEDVRIELARKIIFGLEFVIAADIILAAVTVDLSEIYQLGGIVLIRVLLGYSVRKEIIAG